MTMPFSDNSRRRLDHAVARGTEILLAAGAHDVGVELPVIEGRLAPDGDSPHGQGPEPFCGQRMGP